MRDPVVKLARMANQIAAFFRSYPEDEAIEGVRNHVDMFWTRRMRSDLAARLDDAGLSLDPLVVAAFGAPADPAAQGSAGRASGFVRS